MEKIEPEKGNFMDYMHPGRCPWMLPIFSKKFHRNGYGPKSVTSIFPAPIPFFLFLPGAWTWSDASFKCFSFR